MIVRTGNFNFNGFNFNFIITLFNLITSSMVVHFTFELRLQAPNVISGQLCLATQFNWPTNLRY